MLAALREISISIISILAYKLRAVLSLILQSLGFLFIVIVLKIPAQELEKMARIEHRELSPLS